MDERKSHTWETDQFRKRMIRRVLAGGVLKTDSNIFHCVIVNPRIRLRPLSRENSLEKHGPIRLSSAAFDPSGSWSGIWFAQLGGHRLISREMYYKNRCNVACVAHSFQHTNTFRSLYNHSTNLINDKLNIEVAYSHTFFLVRPMPNRHILRRQCSFQNPK